MQELFRQWSTLCEAKNALTDSADIPYALARIQKVMDQIRIKMEQAGDKVMECKTFAEVLEVI